MPSRVVDAPTAAHKSIVSPYRITQDPSACLATRPTSTLSSRSPTRIDSFKYFFTVILVRLLLTTPTAWGRHAASRPLRFGLVNCRAFAVCDRLRREIHAENTEGGRAWP